VAFECHYVIVVTILDSTIALLELSSRHTCLYAGKTCLFSTVKCVSETRRVHTDLFLR